MLKATKWLLVAALTLAGMGGARAADRAGIGLEWGWAPTVNFNGLGVDFSGQSFSLDWKVTDSFSVGVFSSQGTYNGSHEYSDDVSSPGNTIKDRVSFFGQTAVSGLSILATVPVVTFLQAGLEAGVMQISDAAASYSYVRSDGTNGSAADFTGTGIAPSFPNQAGGAATAGLVGLMAKATLVSAESKTVSASIAVSGALRFVSLPEVYAYGSQEANTTTTPTKKIDPISNFNSLALGVTAALWF